MTIDNIADSNVAIAVDDSLIGDSAIDKGNRPKSDPWLQVMSSRGGPVTVNRAASQQGALLAACIAAGAKGCSVDQLVDAARPYTRKATADYDAYLLSYFVPSWVRSGNGYGLQVKSTDRSLQRQLKDLQTGLGSNGADRGLRVSVAYKLAKGLGKVGSLRLRLTVPNGTDVDKGLAPRGLPRDTDLDS